MYKYKSIDCVVNETFTYNLKNEIWVMIFGIDMFS